jgi:hypothetical protein
MKFEVGCKLGTQIGPAVGPQFLTRVCKGGKGTRFKVRGGDALSDYRTPLSPGNLKALVCGKGWIYNNEGLHCDGNGELDVLFDNGS